MDTIVKVLLKPVGPWLLLAAAVALLSIGGGGAWWITSNYYSLKIANEHLAIADARVERLIGNGNFYADLVLRQQAIVGQYIQKIDDIAGQTQSRIEEAHRHVTPEVDRHYPLPWSLIRVHDSAATGVGYADLAAGLYGADDAPAAVTASDFAVRLALNYGNCRKAYEWGQALMDDDLLVRQMYNDYRAKVAGKDK